MIVDCYFRKNVSLAHSQGGCEFIAILQSSKIHSIYYIMIFIIQKKWKLR